MEGINSLKRMPTKQSVTVPVVYVDIETPVVERKGKTHSKNNFNEAFGKKYEIKLSKTKDYMSVHFLMTTKIPFQMSIPRILAL